MPFRLTRILVGSDLSERTADVVRSAGALASLTGAKLHVVHAVEDTVPDGGMEARRKQAERALREQLRTEVGDAAPIDSIRVAPGQPDELILQWARDSEVNLIVIGPHRETGSTDRALGTTADHLVRASSAPCLIIRDAIALPLRRIMVPCDLSEAARGALDAALTWSAALRVPSGHGERTVVDVLYVIPPDEDDPDAAGRALQAEIDDACERTGCADALDIRPRLVTSEDVVDGILQQAASTGVDLLVVGTHGHTAADRAAIGGVSSAIARRTQCPVLLVPPLYWLARRSREEMTAGHRPG